MAKPKKTNSGGRNFSRTQRGYRDRNSTRDRRGTPKKRFLIVCEGTKTEPNYFEALGKTIKSQVTLTVKGEGKVSLSLVKKAIELKKDGEYDQKKDEVWCVFDRDCKRENNNQQNFNQAIKLAHSNDINLGVSNDAFELWFLLHFSYYDSQTHRNDFADMLTSKMREKYNKNDLKNYEKLEDKQMQAIKYAAKLWHSHD